MSKDLFGKTLAECQGYHFTAVKANTNGSKFITLNTEKGNRETAVNIYLSNNLANKIAVGEYVHPQSLIREMVTEDEETGEISHWPLLTSNSTYVTLDELLAMFS